MKKCLFIYNPISGKGRIKKNEKLINDTLSTKYQVEVCQSMYKGNITKLILDKGENADLIVIAGGDGTLNEVINALYKIKNKPVLGYIPSGTVNDIAHSLKIPTNIRKALNIILNGKIYEHDIFKVNDKYGMYVCCAGLFTETSYATSQSSKKRLGKLAYFFHGIKKIFSTPAFPLSITFNGSVVSGKYAMLLVVNSRSIGGFIINKKAQLNDGLVDVVLIKSKKNTIPLSSIFSLAKVFLSGIPKNSTNQIQVFRTSKFSLTTLDNTIINLDGEKISNGSFNFEVIKKGVRILVP